MAIHRPRAAIRVIGPSIAYIPLTKGFHSLVDADKVDELTVCCWFADMRDNGRIYARGQFGKKRIAMHRKVLGNDSPETDHINGNGLDNRKANLRPASHSQNQFNCRVHSRNTSGFKGVTKATGKKPWIANIGISGRIQHLGSFSTPEEAHEAYCTAAREAAGEFYRAS